MLNIARVAGALVLALNCCLTMAQSYPDKPVRVIVPFPPGGSIDMVARLVGTKLSSALGQPVVIDNRPGAGGNIGMDFVAKAAPDGYTLLAAPNGLAANAHLFAKLPFDPEKHFTPIIRIADQPNVLVVRPGLGVKTVAELVAKAKAAPGKITFGSAGAGSTQQVAAELFMAQAGVQMLHVPYKGGAPALADLLGGQIDIMFETSPTALPYISSGKLLALGVTTAKRVEILPQVPPLAEAGLPGFEFFGWVGLAAPAGTPPEVIAKLNGIVAKAVREDLKKPLTDLTLMPVGDTPEAFKAYIKQDSDAYARIVKEANIPVQ